MARVLVVADDLTGANACAAGFARSGLRSVTVGLGRRWDAIAEFHPRFDVIVATTESRHSPAVEADTAVRQAVRAGWPIDLACCRVDTTLRGNVGVAARALLEEVGELSGRRTVGLCVPAYPLAGRVTVGGHQLLNGRRLEETELAHDVRTPMTTSVVCDIVGSAGLTTALLPLDHITGPAGALEDSLRAAVASGVDVVVADALDQQHIHRIATAAAAVTGIVWCAIDPGPASLALATSMGIRGTATGRSALVVSGSATALTMAQLEALIAQRNVLVVQPVREEGSALPDIVATTASLLATLRGATGDQVVLLASVLKPDDVVSLSASEADELPARLGTITRRALQECAVGGLYTTGGDITTAVLQALGGRGIEIEDEVVPLAVAGSIVGGSWSDLPIVTKGGLIGDEGTAVACVDHVVAAAFQRSRWVDSATPRTAL